MLDFVVLGNGILGLSLAFRLKRDNPAVKVALVGPSHRRGNATLAAGAMLNVWAEVCHGQFEDPFLSKRFQLALRGMDLWESFAREIEEVTGRHIGINWGTYVINTPLAAPWGDQTWSYFKNALKDNGVEHQVMDPLEVPYLEPAQDSRPLDAVKIPDGYFNPMTVISALDKAMADLGVEVYDKEAERIDFKGTFRRTFRTFLADQSTLDSGAIVLANGSFAQALIDRIPSLRKEVPRLLWGAGSALEVSFPAWVPEYQSSPLWEMDCVLRGLNPVGACGLHVVPRGEFCYYVGASSAVLYDREWDPSAHSIGFLIHSVVREVNRRFAHATVKLVGNGFRPITIDMFPLLGESNIPGLWFLNGMKRDGLTSAPYLASELAAEMGGKQSSLPEEFRPARSLIPYKEREAAIKDAVLFGINADRQHELRLPPWMDEKLIKQRTDELEAIYAKRNLRNFGMHPEVTHIYENDRFYKGVKHSLMVN